MRKKLIAPKRVAVRYRNPWYKPGKSQYGPEYYETEVRAATIGEYRIYERIKGTCWDVVKGGVCCTQRAGLGGAKRWIEEQQA